MVTRFNKQYNKQISHKWKVKKQSYQERFKPHNFTENSNYKKHSKLNYELQFKHMKGVWGI